MPINGQKRTSNDETSDDQMNRFTRILVALFICAGIASAAVLFARGAYGAAAMSLAIAMFFLGISLIAIFESRHPLSKPTDGDHRATLMEELRRYWQIPGWQGKFAALFCGSIIAIGLVSQAVAIFR